MALQSAALLLCVTYLPQGIKANGNKEAEQKASKKVSESDSESEDDNDDECKRILESGGRDRCAYFFWQGELLASCDHTEVM